jgi:hypothetical protein
MPSEPTSKSTALNIIDRISKLGELYDQDEPKSREQLLNLAYALVSALELPSEAIMRMGAAEVCFPGMSNFTAEYN